MTQFDPEGPRGIHDMGGMPAGPIDRDDHIPTTFERRVDALMMLMIGPDGLFRADALRRAIEAYNEDDYNHLAYYEKWCRALRILLVEQGVLNDAQIDAKIAELRQSIEGAGA
jgi:hypothetical protein